MKAKELRDQSVTEIKTAILDTRRAQFNLRMQRTNGEQPKGHIIRQQRRDIARLKTVLRQKTLSATQA